LLPTIRSRALRLNLNRADETEALAWLVQEGLTQSNATRALAMSRGAPLNALALASGEALDTREKFFRDLGNPRELPTLAWGAWVEAGGKSGRRGRFALILALLGEWLTDWARVRASLRPATCGDFVEALSRIGDKLPSAEALRYHRELLRKLYLPDTTLSARLQVEAILLDYRSKFA
jgi:DNA polymerase III subunit delta'